MTALSFTIAFHSPFRVGSAYARDSVDAALDEHDPLPPDHLKGLMRAAAVDLLGAVGHPAVLAVFGSPASPSPWSWSSAHADWSSSPADQPPGKDWKIDRRHRVSIDPQTHTAIKDQLVLGEQAWAPAARFQVTRAGILDPSRLGEPDHILILRCSAAAVHGLGAWRRRGLGWVGVTPDDGKITAAEAGRLQAMAGARQ